MQRRTRVSGQREGSDTSLGNTQRNLAQCQDHLKWLTLVFKHEVDKYKGVEFSDLGALKFSPPQILTPPQFDCTQFFAPPPDSTPPLVPVNNDHSLIINAETPSNYFL